MLWMWVQSGFDYGVGSEHADIVNQDYSEYEDDEEFDGFDIDDLDLPEGFLEGDEEEEDEEGDGAAVKADSRT